MKSKWHTHTRTTLCPRIPRNTKFSFTDHNIMLHCILQSSSNDYESQWNSITKCKIITVSLVKSLFLWLLINKILFTLKNHFYFSDSLTKVILKVPFKSLFCLIKILWLQITLKQFSLKSLFLEWLIYLLINVCSYVLQNHISLMMESSNSVNSA